MCTLGAQAAQVVIFLRKCFASAILQECVAMTHNREMGQRSDEALTSKIEEGQSQNQAPWRQTQAPDTINFVRVCLPQLLAGDQRVTHKESASRVLFFRNAWR